MHKTRIFSQLSQLFGEQKSCQKDFLYNIKKLWFCSKTELEKTSDDKQKNDRKESPLKGLLENAATFEDAKPKDAEQMWATLPYAQGVKIRKQGMYDKPRIDPRGTTVIMFPGQGNQYVGMAKQLLKFPMVKDLFDLANYVLGYDFILIIFFFVKDLFWF